MDMNSCAGSRVNFRIRHLAFFTVTAVACCAFAPLTSRAQTPKASPASAQKKVLPQKKYDVTGSWRHSATVSDGGMGVFQESYKLDLQQEGSTITGTMSEGSPVKGSIDGSKVVLTITRSSMGGKDVVYEGNLLDPYNLKGVTRVRGGRPGSWNASREMPHTKEMLDAAGKGDLELITKLLKENPDLALCKDEGGETPLLAAADKDNKDLIVLLLSYKADVNAKNALHETPLHAAAYAGHKDIVEVLLARGAIVNTSSLRGVTPLHYAAEAGSRDVTALLLSKGAVVNAKTDRGETPLHLAVSNGHKDVAELLRQRGGHE
jgi:hypothetical protein